MVQTAIALTCTVLLVGGVGSALVTDYVAQQLLERSVANSAFAANAVAQSLESQLRGGADRGEVLASLQASLRRTPADATHFLYLVSRDGTVLCHPDQAVVDAGMTVNAVPAYDLDEGPAGTYGGVVSAGVEGSWLVGQDVAGEPTELVYVRPVANADWTLAVHQQRSTMTQEVQLLRRHIVQYLVPVGILVVLLGTVGVRLFGRRYERRIESMNARLEQTVARRTEELRSTLDRLRQAHDRLLKGEKMNLLGELMAGIAHEINNPLTSVLVHAELLEDDVQGDAATMARYVASIQTSAERCARVVRALLEFARGEDAERVPVPVAQLVRDVITLVGSEVRAQDVELSVDLAPRLPTIEMNPQQIQQVLMNLIQNAAQAMAHQPGVKRIEIVGDDLGGFARLCVRDNGPGVPAHVRDRVFDSFITTKAGGQGTGLGLSLCKRFVEAHGGTIRLRDTAAGALFEVRLPVQPHPAPPRPTAA